MPEDDDEDIDFTVEGLLGPLESDAEDNMLGAEPQAHLPQSGAAADRPRRHAGAHDQAR